VVDGRAIATQPPIWQGASKRHARDSTNQPVHGATTFRRPRAPPDSSSIEQSNERGLDAIAIEIMIWFANRVPFERGRIAESAPGPCRVLPPLRRAGPKAVSGLAPRFARLCSFAPRSPPEALYTR
jgi:hypothetical protein